MAVDDLFGGGGSAEPPSPIPRLRRWLLWAGILVMAGPFCCTGPVGALVSIWLWARAGDEMKRAELGLYPPAVRAEAREARNQAFGLMSASSLSLCLQALMFGWYQAIAIWAVERVLELTLLFSTP